MDRFDGSAVLQNEDPNIKLHIKPLLCRVYQVNNKHQTQYKNLLFEVIDNSDRGFVDLVVHFYTTRPQHKAV